MNLASCHQSRLIMRIVLWLSDFQLELAGGNVFYVTTSFEHRAFEAVFATSTPSCSCCLGRTDMPGCSTVRWRRNCRRLYVHCRLRLLVKLAPRAWGRRARAFRRIFEETYRHFAHLSFWKLLRCAWLASANAYFKGSLQRLYVTMKITYSLLYWVAMVNSLIAFALLQKLTSYLSLVRLLLWSSEWILLIR